jgi:hypothetical protein
MGARPEHFGQMLSFLHLTLGVAEEDAAAAAELSARAAAEQAAAEAARDAEAEAEGRLGRPDEDPVPEGQFPEAA